MKRLLTSAAMFLCSLLTFAQFSGSGSGTENDPYLIMNPIQLNQLRNFLNKSGVYFKLMADIDLTDFLEDENPSQGWSPVGTSSSPFSGILDGNGKTISGLWIRRGNNDYVGLFGKVNYCTIKNLKVIASIIEGKKQVGGFCGGGYSTITGCSFTGKIKGDSKVGGYIGDGFSSTLSNNIAIVDISSTGKYVGGFFGYAAGEKISNSRVISSSIEGKDYAGGICGYNEYGGNVSNYCCPIKIGID